MIAREDGLRLRDAESGRLLPTDRERMVDLECARQEAETRAARDAQEVARLQAELQRWRGGST